MVEVRRPPGLLSAKHRDRIVGHRDTWCLRVLHVVADRWFVCSVGVAAWCGRSRPVSVSASRRPACTYYSPRRRRGGLVPRSRRPLSAAAPRRVVSWSARLAWSLGPALAPVVRWWLRLGGAVPSAPACAVLGLVARSGGAAPHAPVLLPVRRPWARLWRGCRVAWPPAPAGVAFAPAGGLARPRRRPPRRACVPRVPGRRPGVFLSAGPARPPRRGWAVGPGARRPLPVPPRSAAPTRGARWRPGRWLAAAAAPSALPLAPRSLPPAALTPARLRAPPPPPPPPPSSSPSRPPGLSLETSDRQVVSRLVPSRLASSHLRTSASAPHTSTTTSPATGPGSPRRPGAPRQ